MPESYAGNTQGDPEFENYIHTADDHLELRVPVEAGQRKRKRRLRVREPEGVLQRPLTGFGRSTNERYHGYPAVEFAYIGGPFGEVKPGDTLAREMMFVCHPTNTSEEEPCAREILPGLAARAYRRPVTDSEVGVLLDFYRQGREQQDFKEEVRLGLERILAEPSFLFRLHEAPAGLPAAPFTR